MAKLDAAELAAFYADYVDCWNRVDALRDCYEAELREYPDLTMECVRLFVDVESQAMAAENIERGTGLELRGALFLTLGPEGRISEITEYLGSGNADH